MYAHSNFEPHHLEIRFLFSGDNILAVLRYLLTSEKLADSSEYRHGNMVFFDLLGVVVVAYPARVGTILNYMVATATFLYLAKKGSLPGNGGGSHISFMSSLVCGVEKALTIHLHFSFRWSLCS